MLRMEDVQQEVKNVVSVYLHRRNYCSLQTFPVTKKQQLYYSMIETVLGRANSVLYRGDPLIIEQNFTNFLIWLRDQIKVKNRFHDIESIITPLFCYLYIEILHYEHTDRAASFFKCHFPSINENKCDRTIRDCFFLNEDVKIKDKDISRYKEKIRRNRLVLHLNNQSLKNFKHFVLQNCHIAFVQVLQTYFDFQVNNSQKKEKVKSMHLREDLKENKFQKFLNVKNELKKKPTPIHNICIKNNKCEVPCGLLKRQSGLVVFAENNSLHLIPFHSLDPMVNATFSKPLKFTHHSDYIYCIDISIDNKILVSGSADRTLCIYNLENMSLVKKCTGHLGTICCVKMSGNGTYVATGSADGTARLWQTKTGKAVRIFCGHTQTITCIVFHPNSMYIATGSGDKNIRLWCVNKASCQRLLQASKGIIYDLAFSPCGKLLASASEDKSIKVWDLLSSKVNVELRCKDSPILKIVWNATGTEVCAGTIDGIVRIWNVNRVYLNCETNKHIDPIFNYKLDTKLLNIEYTFGTFGLLTVGLVV